MDDISYTLYLRKLIDILRLLADPSGQCLLTCTIITVISCLRYCGDGYHSLFPCNTFEPCQYPPSLSIHLHLITIGKPPHCVCVCTSTTGLLAAIRGTSILLPPLSSFRLSLSPLSYSQMIAVLSRCVMGGNYKSQKS